MNDTDFVDRLIDMIRQPEKHRAILDELHDAWMNLDSIENDDEAKAMQDRLGKILDALDPIG
jgi:hypothetical protein